ncbi:nucleoside monophosphate kinase [bacterium]|nr:nucleoside monophosphate kinase [bacterium]
MHHYIIMGPQGSGKGTQARRLAADLGIVAISMGEILRGHMANNSPIGQRIRHHMETGQLVTDEIVDQVITDRLRQPDVAKGFVLDGFPRTPGQAEFFLTHHRLDAAILLEVSEETLRKRILGRRLCDGCGKDFNVYFRPPKVEDVCDLCGGKLSARTDDTPEGIRQRLSDYRSKTQPVVDMLRQKGLVLTIPAESHPDEVHKQVLRSIGVE